MKTKPFKHQQSLYDAQKDNSSYALFWEMGLGKTKAVLDVVANQYEKERIECLLVIAPKSVYTNWLLHECPAHLSSPYIHFRFRSSDSYKENLKRQLFLSPDLHSAIGKLRVVVMHYNGLNTEYGMEFANLLCKIYKTFIVLDESTAIKNADTKTAKRCKTLGKLCHFRWIMTGTPVAQSPFDIHSQIEFLEPNFWANHGLKAFGAFKNQFGVFERKTVAGGKQFNQRVAYRELDRLHKIVAPISNRLLKEDSEVELPPKLYTTRTFEMTSEQKRVYEALRQEFMTELEGGGFVEAALAFTRITRLQQIANGFVMAEHFEDGETPLTESIPFDEQLYQQSLPLAQGLETITPKISVKEITDVIPPEENPRLDLLGELIQASRHRVIVWCRFKKDIANCEWLLNKLEIPYVKYDGSVKQIDREAALKSFTDPKSDCRVFLANLHAVSHGVTLTIAKLMIYYSNSFSPEKRLQSEDRFHRIGQTDPVQIIDLEAEKTVDAKLINSLRQKFDVAASVMGDRYREWISASVTEDD